MEGAKKPDFLAIHDTIPSSFFAFITASSDSASFSTLFFRDALAQSFGIKMPNEYVMTEKQTNQQKQTQN